MYNFDRELALIKNKAEKAHSLIPVQLLGFSGLRKANRHCLQQEMMQDGIVNSVTSRFMVGYMLLVVLRRLVICALSTLAGSQLLNGVENSEKIIHVVFL